MSQVQTYSINSSFEIKKPISYGSMLFIIDYLSRINSFFRKWTGIIGITIFLVSFSPILLLIYLFAYLMFGRLDKLVLELKDIMIKGIGETDFDGIKKDEEMLTKALLTLYNIEKSLFNSRLLKPLYNRVKSVSKNLEFMVELCKSKYHFSKEELFDTEEEFNEYIQTFGDLGGVWNYDTTKEEQAYAYQLRKSKNH